MSRNALAGSFYRGLHRCITAIIFESAWTPRPGIRFSIRFCSTHCPVIDRIDEIDGTGQCSYIRHAGNSMEIMHGRLTSTRISFRRGGAASIYTNRRGNILIDDRRLLDLIRKVQSGRRRGREREDVIFRGDKIVAVHVMTNTCVLTLPLSPSRPRGSPAGLWGNGGHRSPYRVGSLTPDL